MSISEDYTKRYSLVPKKHLFDLDCSVRDFSERRIRLNPIIDFDQFHCSKLNAPGIKDCYAEDETSKIVFEPHNFPKVHHLQLAESTFVRTKKPSEESLRFMFPWIYVQNLYSEFDETCARKMVRELLTRIAEIPHSISRLIRNFLRFSRISGCIRKNEMLPMLKLCLTAMYRQEQEFGSDGNLTVEILMTLCVLQQHKMNLVMGDYSYDLIDYVFRCCSAAKFNIEKYLNYSRGSLSSFCPVTACFTSFHHDFRKLKVLLQHGFEFQGSILRKLRSFNDETWNTWKTCLLNGPLIEFSSRRKIILLFFLHVAYASLRDSQWEWVDSTKLVFNSIPDPYISEHDVSFLNSHELKQSVFTKFKGSYTTTHSPRTLKHLSRCVIRKVLKVNFELPNGINALPLPPAIQSYLKHLED